MTTSQNQRRGLDMSVRPPGELLDEMLTANAVPDGQGGSVPLIDALSREHAEALLRTVIRYQPRLVIEVGMGYASSTLAILEGLRVLGGNRRLISIDPMEVTHYNGLGARLVRASSMADAHTLDERFDYQALPALASSGIQVDFAYIDGWHTFDYVLLDFFYLDRLLKVGGVVGFNDCYMVAVNKAIRYVQTHRDYSEIDVGLPVRHGSVWRGRNPVRRAVRRLLDIRDNDRYFRKESATEPNWDFYPRNPSWFMS